MDGIDTIAAPSDLSPGWTLFRMEQDKLKRGIEGAFGENDAWEDVAPNVADQTYQAGYPFRPIAHPQYKAMTTCVEHGFYKEIAMFIKSAFPERTVNERRDQILEKVKAAADISRSQGASEESEIYYWAILSYLVGPAFYEEPRVQVFLAQAHLDMAGKLEMLLEELNKIDMSATNHIKLQAKKVDIN
ncbi:hypothetical protein [Nereida sp. MMG025]|uniref:hypothetical protein n=1 Tax=Nereida sp. MMG025 TaxID=2909981 RepID=UPI001F2C30BC|nr:hypothetical protein [Nereida sp. MMG025]MCF6445021.1 hypothetical protein [Nereida sp. MMG025]